MQRSGNEDKKAATPQDEDKIRRLERLGIRPAVTAYKKPDDQ